MNKCSFSIACLIAFVSNVALANESNCVYLLNEKALKAFDRLYGTHSSYQYSSASNWKVEKTSQNTELDNAVEFEIEHSNRYVESDRLRAQLNVYGLPESVNTVFYSGYFTLNKSVKNYEMSMDENQWLNIFEIWNQPAWENGTNAFKFSINLTKNKDEHTFYPTLSAQYKKKGSSNWTLLWSSDLDIEVHSDKKYRLDVYGSAHKINSLMVEVSSENESTRKVFFDGLVYPYTNSSARFWGINPFKLYSGVDVVERVAKHDAKLAIKFEEPTLCLFEK